MGNLANQQDKNECSDLDTAFLKFREKFKQNRVKDNNCDSFGITASLLTEQSDQFFEIVYEQVMKEGIEIDDQHEILQKIVSSNIQKNEDTKDKVKQRGERAMEETNALFACGFKNAESNIEDLKNPYFEKYFTVLENSEKQQQFSDILLKKIPILFWLYHLKCQDQENESFEEYVQKFFEDSQDDTTTGTQLQIGFGFILGILKGLKGTDQHSLLSDLLENLVDELSAIEPGSLFDNTATSFKFDMKLNETREFLENLIQDEQTPQRIKVLSAKVIFLMGLTRSNIEDMLAFCRILSDKNLGVGADQGDLRQQLRILQEMDKGSRKERKYPDEIKVIKNPPMNTHGSCSLNDDGSYTIARNTDKDTYLTLVHNLQRPVKVEAWMKATKQDDQASLIGGSMLILNPANSEKGGYSINVKADKCCYGSNRAVHGEDQVLTGEFQKCENHLEWHKVVIDARADKSVVYQVHQNQEVQEYRLENDGNLQVGTLKFQSYDNEVMVKDIKITQTIKKEPKASFDEDFHENEYVEILDSVPQNLKSFNFENQNMQSSQIEPNQSKAFDGRYLYITNREQGIVKIDVSQGGFGQVVATNDEFKDDVSLMILNDKIYLRSDYDAGPFQILDKNTLQEVSVSEEDKYNPPEDVKQKLNWESRDSEGRSLEHTPLISYENFVYVISVREPMDVGEYDEEEDKLHAFMVEKYELQPNSLLNFKFVEEVQLTKKKSDKKFVKESNTTAWLEKQQWATNGEHLLCYSPNGRLRYFSLKTGKVEYKTETGFPKNTTIVKNKYSNQFVKFETSKTESTVQRQDFLIKHFDTKKNESLRGMKQEEFDKIAQSLLEKDEKDKNINQSGGIDLIGSLMRGKKVVRPSEKEISEAIMSKSKLSTLTTAYILKFLSHKSKQLDMKLEKLVTEKRDPKTVLEVFRYPFASYLTANTFKSIAYLLEQGSSILHKDELDQVEVYEVHFAFDVLKILLTNLKSLNYCQISLDDIMEESDYKRLKNAVAKFLDNEFSDQQIEGIKCEESKQGLQMINTISQKIKRESIGQISSQEEMLTQIETSLNSKDPNSALIYFVHLSQIKNLRQMFEKCKIARIMEIFRKVVGFARFQGDFSEVDSSDIMIACRSFIQNLSHELIARSVQKAEYDEAVISLIEISFGELATHFSKIIKTLQKDLDETQDWEQMKDKFKTFSSNSGLFIKQNPFYALSMILLQVFSICKISNIGLTEALFRGGVQVAEILGQFFTIWKKFGIKLGLQTKMSVAEYLNKVIPPLEQIVSKAMRQINWHLGLLAYNLIKIDPEEKQEKRSQQDDIIKMVLHSNLLSGGFEQRHLGIFSEKTKKQMIGYARIMEDETLTYSMSDQKLTNGSNGQDLMIEAIISEGKDPQVDAVIKYLQLIYETRKPIPIARIGGEAGLRMSRAAFAIMIKFSDLVEDFNFLNDAIQMQLEMDEDEKAMIEYIKMQPHVDLIISKWISAANMRQWINEKKKNIMTKIERDVEKDFKASKLAKKDESQIDSSVSHALTTDEKQIIEDKAFEMQQKELQIIFEKIITKAMFLIKLSIPPKFKRNDPTRAKSGQLALLRPPSTNLDAPKVKIEWEQRLKLWKQMQTSKGAIKSLTEIKSEIWNSGITSIMALLQTSIESDDIQLQVEQTYLKGCRRAAGLKMINSLMQIEKPRIMTTDLTGWFCSALRHNKNKLSHFLDDAVGQGNHLESQSRRHFFEIMKVLVHKLKKSTNQQEIRIIMNALKWKFTSRDHLELANLNIFQVLHQGEFLKEAWGMELQKSEIILKDQDQHSLQRSVIDLFEHVFFTVAGRIVESDTGEEMKLKSSSLSHSPILRKSKSVVDTNVSETVITQALDIIFKEIDKYTETIPFEKKIKKLNEVFDYGDEVDPEPKVEEIKGEIKEESKEEKKEQKVPIEEAKTEVQTTEASQSEIKPEAPVAEENKQEAPKVEEEEEHGLAALFCDADYDDEQIIESKPKSYLESEGWHYIGVIQKADTLHIFTDTNVVYGVEGNFSEPQRINKGYLSDNMQKFSNHPLPEGQVGSFMAQGSWAKCGEEHSGETYTISNMVRYGNPGKWIREPKFIIDGSQGWAATNEFFGGDPDHGRGKIVEQFIPSEEIHPSKAKNNKAEEVKAEPEVDDKDKVFDYHSSFIERLLRLLEIFTSVATKSSNPLTMVKKIANPHHLSSLLKLLVVAYTDIQQRTLQILQHILQIQLPSQFFEEAMTKLQEDKQFNEKNVQYSKPTHIQFSDSLFLKFLYQYLLSNLEHMWTKGCKERPLVAQSLIATLSLILNESDGNNSVDLTFSKSLRTQIEKGVREIQQLDPIESDAVLSIMGGGLDGMNKGNSAITQDGQIVTILGFTENWKPIDLLKLDTNEGDGNEILARVEKSSGLYLMQKEIHQQAVCLFYDKMNPQRQEMILVDPLKLKLVPSLNKEKSLEMAVVSPLMDPAVLTKFMDVLNSPKDDVYMRQKQAQILKIFSNQIEIMGNDFIDFLKKNSCLDSLVVLLKNHENKKCKDVQKIPTKMIELKLCHLRVHPIQQNIDDAKAGEIKKAEGADDKKMEVIDQIQGSSLAPVAEPAVVNHDEIEIQIEENQKMEVKLIHDGNPTVLDKIEKKVKGFVKLNDVEPAPIAGTYTEWLGNLEKQYANTINLYHGDLMSELLLKIIDKGDMADILTHLHQSAPLLMKYYNKGLVQMIETGQQEKYLNIKRQIKKIVKFCLKQKDFGNLPQEMLSEGCLKKGQDLDLNLGEGKLVEDILKEDTVNPYYLRFIVKILIQEQAVDLLATQNVLPNILTLHLILVNQYSTDRPVVIKLLKSTLKLIHFIKKNLSKFVKSDLVLVTNNKIFKTMLQHISLDQDDGIIEQNLLLVELGLIVDDLRSDLKIEQQQIEERDQIKALKKACKIVNENEKFDQIMYDHFRSQLTTEDYKTMEIVIKQETGFDVMVKASYDLDGFKYKLDRKEVKLQKFEQIRYSDDKGNTTFDEKQISSWQTDSISVTYPVLDQSIIGFGENKYGSLGFNSTVKVPTVCQVKDGNFKPISIFGQQEKGLTAAIDAEGNFYETGFITSDRKLFEFTKNKNIQNVKLVSLGDEKDAVVLKDNSVWQRDRSSFRQEVLGDDFDKFVQVAIPEQDSDNVIQIIAGTNEFLAVTESGKLWTWSYVVIGNRKPTLVDLPNQMLCKQAWLADHPKGCRQSRMILQLAEKSNQDQSRLYSSGINDDGILGLGKDIKVQWELKEICDTNFTQVSVTSSYTMAIDDKNQIWGWGQNINKVLCSPNAETIVWKPTLIQKLNDLKQKPLKIRCGPSHTLIQFESIGLYSVGAKDSANHFAHLGVKQDEANDEVRKIPDLQGRCILDFEAGWLESKVIIKGMEDQLYKHSLSDGRIEHGLLHFYQDKDKKWVFVSEQESKSHEFPDVCFATKCPILDIEKKKWPNLEKLSQQVLCDQNDQFKVKCSKSNQEISGVFYHSRCIIDKKEQEFNFSQDTILQDHSCHINPLIFYRVSKKLKQDQNLPVLNLKYYHKQNTERKLSLWLKPTDIGSEKNTKLIELFKDKWDKMQALDQKIDPKFMREFFSVVDEKLNMHVGLDDVEDFTFDQIRDLKFNSPDLKIEEEVSKQKVELLKQLSKNIDTLLVYRTHLTKDLPNSIFQIYAQARPNFFMIRKNRYIQKQIEKLPAGNRQKVRLSRHLAQSFRDSGKCDHNGEYTIFGQIHKKYKKSEDFVTGFRRNGVDQMAFKTFFEGEGSDDWGGPFRETLANMVEELESDVLPLLIKTSNHRNEHGSYKDCFIPNPCATSPSHETMFKLMGSLLGFNLRTKSSLDWHFPPLFWKMLLEEPLSLGDFEDSDTYSYQMLREIRQKGEMLDAETFDMSIYETFSTVLSNGTRVELQPGGYDKNVTHKNHKTFIELVKQVRLAENEKQMNWIKEGINYVIDLKILTILTWDELEIRACGKQEISADKLKSITSYEEIEEDHKMAKMFWEMFELLDQNEKKKYLKFVWGRTKIPQDCSSLEYKHKITLLSEKSRTDSLPLSHTCFFTVDIPYYTSVEIMLARMRTAIELCGEIDGDDYMLTREVNSDGESIDGEEEEEEE